MKKTRERYSAEFKAKMALEAIRGDLTLAALPATCLARKDATMHERADLLPVNALGLDMERSDEWAIQRAHYLALETMARLSNNPIIMLLAVPGTCPPS